MVRGRARGLEPAGELVAVDALGGEDARHGAVLRAQEATQEVLAADLILHVRDVSHPDSAEQKRDVEAVLDELGIGAEARAARLIEVWNTSDLLRAAEIAALQAAVVRESGA